MSFFKATTPFVYEELMVESSSDSILISSSEDLFEKSFAIGLRFVRSGIIAICSGCDVILWNPLLYVKRAKADLVLVIDPHLIAMPPNSYLFALELFTMQVLFDNCSLNTLKFSVANE